MTPKKPALGLDPRVDPGFRKRSCSGKSPHTALELIARPGLIPAMTERTIILLCALVGAGLIAVLLGTLAHETLGMSRADIRSDALGSAALIALLCGASYLRRPQE